MKKALTIALVLITYSIISKSQISSSLPADSKAYGTTTYLSPDGMLWFGTAPLQYRGVYPKTKIDSLLALVLNNGAPTLNTGQWNAQVYDATSGSQAVPDYFMGFNSTVGKWTYQPIGTAKAALGIPSGGITLATVTATGNITPSSIATTSFLSSESPGTTTFYHQADASGGLLKVDGIWPIRFNINGNEVGRFSSSGNFGIGTTSASDKLQVNLGTNKQVGFRPASEIGGLSTATALQFHNDDRSAYTPGQIEASALILNGNSGGKVGIKTTSPTADLDVNGTGSFSGDLTAPTFKGNLNGSASQWAGNNFDGIDADVSTYVIAYHGSGNIGYTSMGRLQSALGLSSAAYLNNGASTLNAGQWNAQVYDATSGSQAVPDYFMGFNSTAGKWTYQPIGTAKVALGIPSGGITLATVTAAGNTTHSSITTTGFLSSESPGTTTFYHQADASGGLLKVDGIWPIRFNINGSEVGRFSSSGNFGIGTTSPREKLSVNGKIRAQEIKVENVNWPDYVFTKSYYLPTLQETEKHIKEKGHLPGIPSAEEVKTNGIDLGEINASLLQKIEELTLHLIEKDKELKGQRDEIELIKSHLLELTQTVMKTNPGK